MINYNNMVPPMPQLPQNGGGSCSGTWKRQQPQKRKQEQGQGQGIISMSKIRCRLNPRTGNYEMAVPSLGYGILEMELPKDNQYILDTACMEIVANVLSQRYNITKNTLKSSNSNNSFKVQRAYHNIIYAQVDVSRYEFYLPNGRYIGWVVLPNDFQYGQDLALIKEVCKALAYRFGLI